MFRVEDKYYLDELDMYVSERRIAFLLEKDVYSAEKPYVISSLYFDDNRNSCFQDTLSGEYSRNKYRIRIYNHDFSTIKLEVKQKLYNRVRKYSESISIDEMYALIHGESINYSEDSARSMFNRAIKCNGLKPRIIVEYQRTAVSPQ